MRGLKLGVFPGFTFWAVVASFTDAWIETLTVTQRKLSAWSHLLQMRGLKRSGAYIDVADEVASFTDAWIETRAGDNGRRHQSSHLLQMRGLKPGQHCADCF